MERQFVFLIEIIEFIFVLVVLLVVFELSVVDIVVGVDDARVVSIDRSFHKRHRSILKNVLVEIKVESEFSVKSGEYSDIPAQ